MLSVISLIFKLAASLDEKMSSEINGNNEQDLSSTQNMEQWSQSQFFDKFKPTARLQCVETQLKSYESVCKLNVQREEEIGADIDDIDPRISERISVISHLANQEKSIGEVIEIVDTRLSVLQCSQNATIKGKLNYWLAAIAKLNSRVDLLKSKVEEIDEKHHFTMKERDMHLELINCSIDGFARTERANVQEINAIEVAISEEHRKLLNAESVTKKTDQLVAQINNMEKAIADAQNIIEFEADKIQQVLSEAKTLDTELNVLKTKNNESSVICNNVHEEEQRLTALLEDFRDLERWIQSKTVIQEMQSNEIFKREVMAQDYFCIQMEKLERMQSDRDDIQNDLENVCKKMKELQNDLDSKRFNLEFVLSELELSRRFLEDMSNEETIQLDDEAEVQKDILVKKEIDDLRDIIRTETEELKLSRTKHADDIVVMNLKINGLKHRVSERRGMMKSLKQDSDMSRKNEPRRFKENQPAAAQDVNFDESNDLVDVSFNTDITLDDEPNFSL